MFVLVVITITIIIVIVVVALIFLLVYCYKKKGMWLYQRLISLLKGRVDEQSSTVEILFPSNPENHQPALDIETLLLKEGLEESPHPRPLEETEEGIELQDVVVRESPQLQSRWYRLLLWLSLCHRTRMKCSPPLRVWNRNMQRDIL